ncbi:hypothetical protein [Gordonia amicalis]|uniref:hypothetical protein n=1 Tax=Gordonia amicalis TaxID=89053 RepID=UPI00387DC940
MAVDPLTSAVNINMVQVSTESSSDIDSPLRIVGKQPKVMQLNIIRNYHDRSKDNSTDKRVCRGLRIDELNACKEGTGRRYSRTAVAVEPVSKRLYAP